MVDVNAWNIVLKEGVPARPTDLGQSGGEPSPGVEPEPVKRAKLDFESSLPRWNPHFCRDGIGARLESIDLEFCARQSSIRGCC